MIKENFFPTSIYAKDLELDNDKLGKHIIEWSKKDKGLKKTNVNGWHSPNIHFPRDVQGGWHSPNLDPHSENREYIPLVKELYNLQNEIYKEECIDRQPVLGNMWANINPPGGSNEFHTHPNCLFSGVYYVTTPKNSGELIISDPRPGVQQIKPVRKNESLPRDVWREVFLEPKEGRLLMFPAWLWHRVAVNQSKYLRISISFNFVQEGFYV